MAFDDKSIRVVAGIDFGTSRSGYAYAFLDDNKDYPQNTMVQARCSLCQDVGLIQKSR